MDRLTIDIADRADIRRKLPDVEVLCEEKRAELDSLALELQSLERLAQALSALADVGASDWHGSASESLIGTVNLRKPSAPGQEAAIEALRRAGRPMGPAALYRFVVDNDLDDRPANANSLGANLWAAEKRGRLLKTDDGDYLLPEWAAEQGTWPSAQAETEDAAALDGLATT